MSNCHHLSIFIISWLSVSTYFITYMYLLFDIVKRFWTWSWKWFYFPNLPALPRVWYSISTMAYFEFWSTTLHPDWENISIGSDRSFYREQLTAEKKLNCSFYREQLTVDPAFAKMSGDPSICTEGTAKMFNLILWLIQGLLVCTATYISGYVYLGIWGFYTICEYSPHWIYLFLFALSNYSFSAPVRNFEEIQH